jgi:hypothetical protein
MRTARNWKEFVPSFICAFANVCLVSLLIVPFGNVPYIDY